MNPSTWTHTLKGAAAAGGVAALGYAETAIAPVFHEQPWWAIAAAVFTYGISWLKAQE